MNDIRAKFEEIWPVPNRIFWSESSGEYLPHDESKPHLVDKCIEWDARLDTFTRCQETTDVYVSLIDELVAALDHHWTELPDCVNKEITGNLVDRAKQILGREK